MAPKRVTPRGEAAPPPKAQKPKPAAKKTTTAKKAATTPASNVKYIRNIRYVEARLTLENERRFEFKPRGERGDLKKVTEDDLSDPLLLENIGHIIEVISEAEGKEIIRKQQTNASPGVSAAAQLTNERGEAYAEGAVKITQDPQQQAQTVAQITNDGSGRYVENREQITRQQAVGPEVVAVPGSLGHSATDIDAVAREVKGEEAGDILRSQFTVSVEPTQREG